MQYVGIYTQQRSNNIRSIILLLMFPAIILLCVWAFFAIVHWLQCSDGYMVFDWDVVNEQTLMSLPWVVGVVGLWFAIAYFTNTSMIRHATGARPLERRDNPRVYNIVENLCIAGNMPMPKVNVIDDPMLNAFASGVDEKSFTVTVTTGICNHLNDDELAGVIAHELTHIRNRDTRVLIISIVFVGIISMILEMGIRVLWNTLLRGNRSSGKNNGKGGASILVVIAVAVALSVVAYIFILLTRFAISRKREYMADAGGAELCGNPLALASALRKISGNEGLASVEREDVAQLFISRPSAMKESLTSFIYSAFSTHPPIEKRIAILEQF